MSSNLRASAGPTRRAALKAAIGLTSLPGIAAAQAASDAYPSRTGRVIIAFGPGTGGDFLARLVADRLSVQTGGRFVVENRPGAGGATGTKAAADAAADGYTLLLGSNATLIINPTVRGDAPYNPETDFIPIGTVAQTSMVLVTSATAPGSPQSLAELVAAARAREVAYGSPGVGTLGHLSAELMLRKANLRATHVPYRGSTESLTDVMRGEVLFAVDSAPAVLPLVNNGRLRALAVTGESRLESLGTVPTFAQAGMEGMNITVWYCVMAPAGTPPAVIDRLDRELAKMHADPQVLARLRSAEFQVMPLTSERFRPFFAEELRFWRQFVAESSR
jgi:tripartite-type tricarboxylate transporter receptor subunit TctC